MTLQDLQANTQPWANEAVRTRLQLFDHAAKLIVLETRLAQLELRLVELEARPPTVVNNYPPGYQGK